MTILARFVRTYRTKIVSVRWARSLAMGIRAGGHLVLYIVLYIVLYMFCVLYIATEKG